MAHTDVILVDNDGVLVPSTGSVAVISGDTVSFATGDGAAAMAFFSPDALGVLAPTPGSAFAIGAGARAEFSFTSSQPGAYSAYFGHDAGDAPDSFPAGSSQVLRLEINTAVQPPFAGPGDTVGTGHGA